MRIEVKRRRDEGTRIPILFSSLLKACTLSDTFERAYRTNPFFVTQALFFSSLKVNCTNECVIVNVLHSSSCLALSLSPSGWPRSSYTSDARHSRFFIPLFTLSLERGTIACLPLVHLMRVRHSKESE